MNVISKSRRDKRQGGRTVPANLKDWQKIQNLFARIIGANISFIDSSGNFLVKPSRVTPFCEELAKPLDRFAPRPVSCVIKAFQEGLQGKKFYLCPHHLHFLPLKIQLGENLDGLILIGPHLAGNRESEKMYQKIARRLALDSEYFADGIREIKLFSYTALNVIFDFFQDVANHYLNRLVQKRELKHLISGFSSREKEISHFFSMVYTTELSNSLLDIAMTLVKGDSGSVLLFDKKEKCFHIKAACNIQPEYVSGISIPYKQSISGWVIREAKPLLIQKDLEHSALQSRLKRPEINSSFVIPIAVRQGEPIGVLCLNSKSVNKNFNQDNLVLLSQLGKLAGIAFGRENS